MLTIRCPIFFFSLLRGMLLWLFCLKALAAPGADFYTSVPSDLAQFPRGKLLKVEPETDFSPVLQAFHSAYRVMYRSIDQLGKARAVTGMVFVPRGRAPDGGWPVVAWAHGTAGVGAQCAPSRYPDLYGNWPVYAIQINRLLSQGWLVVATDYIGLGPAGTSPYLQAISEAFAVIDSVKAARQLVPEAGRRWAAIGHSQGGQAAVAVAEMARDDAEDLTFIGAAAYAPSQHFELSFDTMAHSRESAPYLGYVAAGIKALNPAFDASKFLGPDYLERLQAAETHCFDQWFGPDQQGVQPAGANVLNPHWHRDPTVRQWVAAHQNGWRKATAPLLLMQGTKDGLFKTYPQYLSELCDAGSTVASQLYPGVDHDQLLEAAWPQARRFLSDRFHGRPADNKCRR